MKCEVKSICRYKDAGCEDNQLTLALPCHHKQALLEQQRRRFESDIYRREEVYLKLKEESRNNAILYHCLAQYEMGNESWDEMMFNLVIELSNQNSHLIKQMQELLSNIPPRPMMIPHP